MATRDYYARNRDKVLASARAYILANPDAHRRVMLRTNFGITLEQYNEMFERQGGVCAICKKPETWLYRDKVRALAVDHDHETGRVRGLLCGNCNRAIGQMLDDPERLRRAADYLEGMS